MILRLHDNAAGPPAGTWSTRILLCLGMALMLAFFVSPGRASAHTLDTTKTSAGQPTLQMVVGFDGNSRLDYWTPAWITLSNAGPDFRGVLAATTYANARVVAASTLPWSYKQPVVLPHGAQKQITIYVPFYESPSVPLGVVATLSDNNGKVIARQPVPSSTLDQGSPLLIGILSDQTAQGAVITPLNAVSLPDPTRPIQVVALDASTLPDMAEALGNFDVIVLDDFSTSALSPTQLAALQTWVNQGGALIEAGGPQWQQTLAALPPQLLPVVINGTGTLPAGTNLLPAGGPTIAEIGQRAAPGTLQKSITISTAILPGKDDARQQAFSSLETVLSSGTTSLIVQAHQGRGIICYLAFDPASEPFVNWPGTIALWKGLLLRTLGDQALIPNTPFRYNIARRIMANPAAQHAFSNLGTALFATRLYNLNWAGTPFDCETTETPHLELAYRTKRCRCLFSVHLWTCKLSKRSIHQQHLYYSAQPGRAVCACDDIFQRIHSWSR